MNIPIDTLSDVQIAERSLLLIRDLIRENNTLLNGVNELQMALMQPGNVQKKELMDIVLKTLNAYTLLSTIA